MIMRDSTTHVTLQVDNFKFLFVSRVLWTPEEAAAAFHRVALLQPREETPRMLQVQSRASIHTVLWDHCW